MSTTTLDERDVLARIDRSIEETRRFVAEQHKLMAERSKLDAERLKLEAEARKLDRDRWLAPVLAAAAIGAAMATVVGLALRGIGLS